LPVRTTMLAIFACLLWSTAFVGIKLGLPYTTPIFFAGLRFILAGFITLGLSWREHRKFSFFINNFPTVLKIGGLQTFLLYLFFYLGLERIDGALAAVITGFSPLWAIILAHFYMKNDQLTFTKVVSFMFGVSGIAIVALSGKHTNSGLDYIGVLLMLSSSLISAVSAIVIAKEKTDIPAIVLNGGQLIVGGFLLVIAALFTEKIYIDPTPQFFGALIYLACLSAVAYSIWFYLLQSGAKISFLNLWKCIIPVCGAVISWAILPGESPTPLAIIGIILVGLSIIIYYSRKQI